MANTHTAGPPFGGLLRGAAYPPKRLRGTRVPNGGAAAFGGPGGLWPPGQPNKKVGAGGKASGSRFSGREAPRRRPGARPSGNLLPRASVHPSAIRRLPWGRRKAGADMRGAAAFWGRGLWPRPQNMPAAGQSPAAGGWAAPTRRRPPRRWDFHQRQKRQRKSPAPRSMGPGTRNVGRKVRGNGQTHRAKPGPMAYGPGRLHSPRRGLLSSDNLARLCANTAVRVAPPWA